MKCPVGQGHTVFGVQERCHRLVTLNVLDGHDVGEATNEACKAWIDKKSVLEKNEIVADACGSCIHTLDTYQMSFMKLLSNELMPSQNQIEVEMCENWVQQLGQFGFV